MTPRPVTKETAARILALLERIYGPADFDARLNGLIYAAARRARVAAYWAKRGWADGERDAW